VNFLRLQDVEARVALKKTEIYRRIKRSEFPQPVKLGHASRWLDTDIDAWMQRIVQTRTGVSQ